LKGVGQSDGLTVGRNPPKQPPSDRPTVRPSDQQPSNRPTGQKLEPTLDNVRAVWSQVISEARAKTPLLGSLLAEAEVVAVDGREVSVRPGHAVHAEGLERQRETIAQALGRFISEAPRVKIAAPDAAKACAPSPARMTTEGANAERLKSLRAKDPTLSAAVDALDLELLE
jgi:hypothetical protein